MLPSLSHTNPRIKDSSDLSALILAQNDMIASFFQFQKEATEKAEVISNGILGNLIKLNQSVSQNFSNFEEISKTVCSESSNIATMVGRIVKLQSHAVRAEKDTLSEIKEMNRDRARSDVQEELPRRLEEKGSATETPPARSSFSALYPISVNNEIRRAVEAPLVPAVQAAIATLPRPSKVPLSEITEEHFGELRERLILVPFASSARDHYETLQKDISVWVGRSFDTVIKECFKGYVQKQMQMGEAKVFFAQNVMVNFQDFLVHLQAHHPAVWEARKFDIMKHFESEAQKVLEFYQAKYPPKKKTMIGSELKKEVRPCNRQTMVKFNTLSNLGCFFPLNEDGNYFSPIKRLINSLIQETKKGFPEFKKIMKEVFTFTRDDGKE